MQVKNPTSITSPTHICTYTVHIHCTCTHRYDAHQQLVKIALVGKYTKLEDSYISVIKALKHAALTCRHRLSLIVRERFFVPDDE